MRRTWQVKFVSRWATKRYTAEFKQDAVALVEATGRTVTEVARELGVSPR
ncbi:transposase [Streptomyces sp. 900105245]